MKRYLKLVNFEFNRFAKLYAILLGIVLIAQVAGVIVICRSYLNKLNEVMYRDQISQAEFIDMFGQMSFDQVMGSAWFLGPIALSIAAVIFYIFFIWRSEERRVGTESQFQCWQYADNEQRL